MIQTITVKTGNIRAEWCVYQLRDMSGIVQYIGYDRLTELIRTPSARRNSLFAEVFGNQEVMNIELLFTGSKWDCVNFILPHMRKFGRPPMNRQGTDISNSFVPIQCVETGEFYNSISEAARMIGSQQSAISNHLNGAPGFKSIKGRTFRRVFFQNV